MIKNADVQVDPNRGLSAEEVEKNRLSFGTNTLEEIKPTSLMGLILLVVVASTVWIEVSKTIRFKIAQNLTRHQ